MELGASVLKNTVKEGAMSEPTKLVQQIRSVTFGVNHEGNTVAFGLTTNDNRFPESTPIRTSVVTGLKVMNGKVLLETLNTLYDVVA